MVSLHKTAFKNINFIDCKLIGMHFTNCSPFLFEVHFNNCLLNLASFYKTNLKKTKFINCNLQDADFTETNLTAAIFTNCDFAGATFEYSVLENADFSTAYNYLINPEINKIKKAKFSLEGCIGLLKKYDITIS